MELIVYLHSAVREQDDRAACGLVVTDALAARPIHEAGCLLGSSTDAATAALRALITALELIVPRQPHTVQFRCNDEAMVQQLTGTQPLTDDALRPLWDQAAALLLQLDRWQMQTWNPDELRRPADLALQAMDSGANVIELTMDEAAAQQRREHTGVPQWTVTLLEAPGPDCPAGCAANVKHPFGPDTPAGFCVHAAKAVLEDGPLTWTDPQQKRITTVCPHCEVPLRIELVD